MMTLGIPLTYEAAKRHYSDALWQATELLVKPHKVALVDTVYKTLWQQIVEGERQQGERFNELELVKELGVSRTPIRQALFRLLQIGLVRVGEPRGFHVAISGEHEIRELFDLLSVLERAATSLSIRHIPNQVLHAALRWIEEMRELEEPDIVPAFLFAETTLHLQITAGYCGNQQICKFIASAYVQLSLLAADRTYTRNIVNCAISSHKEILTKLLERDVLGAEKCLSNYIERTKEASLKSLTAAHLPRHRRFVPRACT